MGTKKTEFASVDVLLNSVKHPLTDAINHLRQIILSTDSTIAEHIKWNSPAFHYTGVMKNFNPKEYKRDLIVLNLHRKNEILLIFPTGDRLTDPQNIFEDQFNDSRRMVKITGIDDARAKAPLLQTVIRQWLEGIEKP